MLRSTLTDRAGHPFMLRERSETRWRLSASRA